MPLGSSSDAPVISPGPMISPKRTFEFLADFPFWFVGGVAIRDGLRLPIRATTRFHPDFVALNGTGAALERSSATPIRHGCAIDCAVREQARDRDCRRQGMARDSDFFQRRAAEARAAAFSKHDGDDAAVA